MISLSITNKIRRKQEHKFKGPSAMELRVQYLKRRTLFGFSNRRILYRHYLMDGSAHTIVSKIIYLSLPCFGSKGWRSGESARCGPGSNPGVDAICELSLLLVLSFAPRGFSLRTPVFPSPQKPTFLNSNSTRNQVDEEQLCGCAISKSLFIYHLFLFFKWHWIKYQHHSYEL